MPSSADWFRVRHKITLDDSRKTTQHDFTLLRGVLISGKLVDEHGNDWPIGQSFGRAFVYKEPPTKEEPTKEMQQGMMEEFSLTDFRNKYRPQSVERASAGTFLDGEGEYASGEMIFPTESTFVIQGMMPGHTIITFLPNKEGQNVVNIMYDGKNTMTSGADMESGGIDTTPGQELKDVTIVIGKQ